MKARGRTFISVSDSHAGRSTSISHQCIKTSYSQKPSAMELQRRTDSQTIVAGMRPIIRAEIPHEAGQLDLLCLITNPRGRNTDRATAHPIHSNTYITYPSCLATLSQARPRTQPTSRTPVVTFWQILGVETRADGEDRCLGKEQGRQNRYATHQ